MPEAFEKDGVAPVLQWAEDMKKPDYRIVKQDLVWHKLFWVSTVWMGIDQSLMSGGKPVLFETMVFCRFPCFWVKIDKEEKKITLLRSHLLNCSDVDQDRYATEGQACVGHSYYLQKWSNPLRILLHLKRHFANMRQIYG
jgi:hypothetical protein